MKMPVEESRAPMQDGLHAEKRLFCSTSNLGCAQLRYTACDNTHLSVLGGGCRPLLIVQVLQASGLSGPAQLPRLVRSDQLLLGRWETASGVVGMPALRMQPSIRDMRSCVPTLQRHSIASPTLQQHLN